MGEQSIMDRLYLWLAWKLPRRLVYEAAMRLMAHATSGEWLTEIVPELTAMEALRRWEVDDAS